MPYLGSGLTALHCAASKGNHAVVEMLLKANADPNAVDGCKSTVANVAEICGHVGLAQRLREAEARP